MCQKLSLVLKQSGTLLERCDYNVSSLWNWNTCALNTKSNLNYVLTYL